MAFIAVVITTIISVIILHYIPKHTTKINQFLLAGLSAPGHK